MTTREARVGVASIFFNVPNMQVERMGGIVKATYGEKVLLLDDRREPIVAGKPYTGSALIHVKEVGGGVEGTLESGYGELMAMLGIASGKWDEEYQRLTRGKRMERTNAFIFPLGGQQFFYLLTYFPS